MASARGLAADDAADNLRMKNRRPITMGSVASFDRRQFDRRAKKLGLMPAGMVLS